MPVARGGPRLTAVLGPTNTGKTHLAVERMLGHASGMIGLPLRLLAREIYDRICGTVGLHQVALITGEEKIIPQHARYFVCTVEAMPVERRVSFLAIDEIQLCADPERGHVFTDRLLRARGEEETMLLGADTMRPLIRQLLPDVQFISRPRFSDLTYVGPKKLSRLPRRSAIVAFSAEAVYGIAELMRSQRGGAAVVMGALSPRTRNAQVALYQSGEVDFLVATDAIGMGINMDVDHIAFAAMKKFDGVAPRLLRATEVAQIAGRAGRHMNDGTFGPTGEVPPFDQSLVEQIEQHRFDPVRVLQWRNTVLNFSSIEALIASLEVPPPAKGLARARLADDLAALKILAAQPLLADKAKGEVLVRMLWDVCQIPDFRKATADEHARLLGQIFENLVNNGNHLPTDWIASQVDRIDITAGDIDTLSGRLAQIRVWTYVAHRAGWLDDAAHWQERTRTVEDALSDALHEALTQRFIDRRTSLLMRRLADTEQLNFAVDTDGEVSIEGEYVGRLNGFTFEPDLRGQAGALGPKTLRQATARVLGPEIAQRAQRLVTAPAAAIQLSEHGKIWWEGAPIARLVPGSSALTPKADLIADELLSDVSRERVQQRLDLWLREHIAHILAPLASLAAASDLDGLARGLAYQIVENFGNLPRTDVGETVRALDQAARAALRRYGVRFGAHSVFLPALLKPAAAQLKVLLWQIRARADDPNIRIPAMPAPGLVSIALEAGAPPQFYERAGFRPCGLRAVRIDMLERLADMLRPQKPMAAITPVEKSVPAEALGVEGEPSRAEPDPSGVTLDERSTVDERSTAPADGLQSDEPVAPGDATDMAAKAVSAVPAAAAPAKTKTLVQPDGSFSISPEMMSIVGASGVEFEALLRSLGYRAKPAPDGTLIWRMGRRKDSEPQGVRRRPPRGKPGEASAQSKSNAARNNAAPNLPFPGSQPNERPEGTMPKAEPAPPEHARSARRSHPRPAKAGDKPAPQRAPAPKVIDKPIDPTSPFAKLAILKEAMMKGR